MRGTVAKRLRQQIYGENSQRKREYENKPHKVYKTILDKDGKTKGFFVNKDTVHCSDLRAEYLKAKANYKGRKVLPF